MQEANPSSSARPLAERLAKWNRTWQRIAERVFNDDSLVQEALTDTEVDHDVESNSSNN